MAQSVSNLSFSIPLSSRARNLGFSGRNCSTRAMAAVGRDSLDHLQRTNNNGNNKNKQSELKRRSAPSVSPIGLWDRFPTARTVQQMMETMDRMMEDPLAYTSQPPATRGRTPWEIKEGETEYKLRFDMPGMTKQDVRVYVEEKMLVVKAEKVATKKINGGENGAAEPEVEDGEEEWEAKSFGKYSWRIALPENVELEKIRAEVRDGVLYLTIPKARVSAKVFDINVQ